MQRRQTRAIRSKADTPAEINEQFDGIAYGKAGAVIGMVEHYVGAGDVFRARRAQLYGGAQIRQRNG